MASQFYNEAKRAIAAGEIDLNADDIRAALLMTNTTADTENDGITTISGFTTLDEHGTAGRVALANEAVNKDDTNDRAEFDADDALWSSLANGARAIQGVLIYKHVTNDTDSIPIAFIEFSATQNPGGSDFTVQWNAEGILQFT